MKSLRCKLGFHDYSVATGFQGMDTGYVKPKYCRRCKKDSIDCIRCNDNGCPDCENIKWNIKE